MRQKALGPLPLLVATACQSPIRHHRVLTANAKIAAGATVTVICVCGFAFWIYVDGAADNESTATILSKTVTSEARRSQQFFGESKVEPSRHAGQISTGAVLPTNPAAVRMSEVDLHSRFAGDLVKTRKLGSVIEGERPVKRGP